LPVFNLVKPNFFRDSIQLMRLSEEAKKVAGVQDAVVSMGTPTNKLLMKQMGLLGKEGADAGEGDMVLALRLSSDVNSAETIKEVQRLVTAPPSQAPDARAGETFYGIETALERHPEANLAVVSVPGQQAFTPSMELLKKGINVHLFSDHVPIDQEYDLKSYASSHGLLLMGPGAGTSIIHGVGIGFANAVKRGNIGIVAAAGTGLQEASVLLDGIGLGVSEAFGVGGSDVSERIGGIMTKQCLGLLEGDKRTALIMIIAKTPTRKVMEEIMVFAESKTSKPMVACFLGLSTPRGGAGRIRQCSTLHSAVAAAARISGKTPTDRFAREMSMSQDQLAKLAKQLSTGLTKQQKYVRGLYSGGTLAHETLLVFRELVGEAYSNTPLSRRFALRDPASSRGNSIVDMGDEFFTAGRAHPMIDPTLRRLRLLQEARDNSVAVIMLDVVLGYGSSSDPGGALAGAIVEATDEAKKNRRKLIVMAHICGSLSDSQSFKDQAKKLSEAGVHLFPTNTLMAIAAVLTTHDTEARERLRLKWRDLIGEI
jgi:succinyl-CoA synthetase alpha subunit